MTRACGDGESVQPLRKSAVARGITEVSLPGSSHVVTAPVKKLVRFIRIVLVWYGRTLCGFRHWHCLHGKRRPAPPRVQGPFGQRKFNARRIEAVFHILIQTVA